MQRSLPRVVGGVHAYAILAEVCDWVRLITLSSNVQGAQPVLVEDIHSSSIAHQYPNQVLIPNVTRVMNGIKAILTQSWTIYPSATVVVNNLSIFPADFLAGVVLVVQEPHCPLLIPPDNVHQHQFELEMRALMDQIPTLVFLVVIQGQFHCLFRCHFFQEVLQSAKISVVNEFEYCASGFLLLVSNL